jgi:DNA adenine methylase
MTFLRWAGSKKQILDTLTDCWYAAKSGKPGARRYIEAFSGSAPLLSQVQPTNAILIDVNADLQDCLATVCASPALVSRTLRSFKNSETEYYAVRAQDIKSMTACQRAARFIYLNRNCFNGLYRTNRQGHFNVPFGGSRSGSLPDEEQLIRASSILKCAELITGDFYDVVAPRIRKTDFVYMDPPYAKRNADLDNQYGPDVFGTNDIQRLGKLATLIDERGGTFVISYAACDEIRPLAKRWTVAEVMVRRTIAANAAHRHRAKELLISNM